MHIIMELKLHCKENVPCQYWYKQNLHCLRQELSAPWHYHHRWRHQKSVCLCVSNHINPLLNGTWLLVMPFSPTNATCRCFSYWFLTFLLSTRWCSSAALLLTRSGVEFLNACTFSHWLLMLACHFFSSPNYFKECSTFPYNLNCTSHAYCVQVGHIQQLQLATICSPLPAGLERVSVDSHSEICQKCKK